eukprot:CAMPEP_0197926828 /NCGR_PEP_ID=MMETSP1439-20131203/99773_1 /TAXON_ID=66791 /ORGANISM="Gonyaulax spinifera, Strain CCMP409" /LENGTH=98 /DNA_ID=CAMNT_0043549379 /DNA_START=9 /DNA_END=305 /DNA_ORIENTATION=-
MCLHTTQSLACTFESKASRAASSSLFTDGEPSRPWSDWRWLEFDFCDDLALLFFNLDEAALEPAPASPSETCKSTFLTDLVDPVDAMRSEGDRSCSPL